jgi:hypothetical protein
MPMVELLDDLKVALTAFITETYNNMLEQVRARILEKLETLTGEGQPLAFAYDYYKKDIEGYPCVMFEPTTVPSEYIDTKYNQRAYNFELLLAHELSNTDRATALNTIIAAFSSILNAFDTDYTL